ncbi:hypothetical protein D3C80_2174880 [compost metagenome]
MALSPTSAWLSLLALTYVPIPPFHSRSTGALSKAFSSSVGVSLSASMSKRSFICGEIAMLFALREKIPPPSDMMLVS